MSIDAATILLTSVSMSVDAMTVNATNGLEEKGISQKKMLFLSAMFGLFQFVMPTIGFFIGHTFAAYIEKAIPWIGFSLLMLLGVKSFIDWLKDFLEDRKAKKEGRIEEETEQKSIGLGKIFVESIATSIDALCIGFAYMSLPIWEAMIFFIVIGVTTFVLSYITVLLAKQLSHFLKDWAGLLASIVFVGIAIKILLEGLL